MTTSRLHRRLILLAGLTALCGASPAPKPKPTAGAAALTLSGRLKHPRSFSLDAVRAMPSITVDLPGGSAPGAPPGQATGVLLWTLLSDAGWNDLPGRKTHMQHVVMARGRDGYTVALSIGEVDPDLQNRQAIVATSQNGTLLPNLDLVVPGDRKGPRHVKDLVALDVR